MTNRRWRCLRCAWIGTREAMLEAPHSFLTDEIVLGCPSCREIDKFELMCDVEDCPNEATCGLLSAAGYRRICRHHR